MSWFDTSGLTSLAKSALKEAQKTIDKALDIQVDNNDETKSELRPGTSDVTVGSTQKTSDFFSSWGLTTSGESTISESPNEQPIITESPSKSESHGLWGSFAGSFFEANKDGDDESALVRPPRAKSMNVITDKSYDSQHQIRKKEAEHESLNSESKTENKIYTIKGDESIGKVEDRRSSSNSNRLSLVSSRNSSDSVEVLSSQSLKTTPDSEAASIHSISHSSSVGHKLNSESVEILSNSLISPSSIECLGFDSFCSDQNSSTPSNISPSEHLSDNKGTPIAFQAVLTDSVSLVADDDEDTISYNSVSECTAPTVLDTDEKLSLNPYSRTPSLRNVSDFQKSRYVEVKPVNNESSILIPIRAQLGENSSNDGSWSDRTLNADNDSVILEPNIDDHSKTTITDTDQEDTMVDKLSDSSSFCNINVSIDMSQCDTSSFINIDKQHTGGSNDSSHKDSIVKERTSPTSSDSKSDLVKLGSDRTSGHTSGDELETATSSDIEIIPSPNGDNGHGFCRQSPAKYIHNKQSKIDGSMSPNLVELVLGKSLASKVRGHNRELSEVSVQSNASDDSQGSENERLLRRLCEMAEVLEARERRLVEMSRSNAELAENNTELKSQLEDLFARQHHESGDISTITEDYTQRMSALEKKFQQAIREKDQLRKQLDSLKNEMSTRRSSAEMERSVREKDEMILQLQEEGEKLSQQQLQQSNIIKKLRSKERDNDQVIKSLRDKIAEQTGELDRFKRSISAKEELEVSQIEIVYRLTTTNKKLETELQEVKSILEDISQKYDTTRTSLDVARRELSELQRSSSENQRRSDKFAILEKEKIQLDLECEKLRAQLNDLRAKMVQEERRWAAREESLRSDLSEACVTIAAYEARVCPGGSVASQGAGEAGGALLAQLAALQQSALERDDKHRAHLERLTLKLAEADKELSKTKEREYLAREECLVLQERLASAETLLEEAQTRSDNVTQQFQQCMEQLQQTQEVLLRKSEELEKLQADYPAKNEGLEQKVVELERNLAAVNTTIEAERKRNAILQEQLYLSTRQADVDVSPPQSVVSDSLSASLWMQDDGGDGSVVAIPGVSSLGVYGVEELVSRLQRREGELRALTEAHSRLAGERRALANHLAAAQNKVNDIQSVQEQYDALLQMYGEKEEQLEEVKLDLQDVTELYKAQLDELIALKQQNNRR